MLFHISACGRSGTLYMYETLKKIGVPVIHEQGHTFPYPAELGVRFLAQNPSMFALYRGLIGWKWSLMTPTLVERIPLQFHLVRHPLRAIESATTHVDSLFDYVESKLGSPRVSETIQNDAKLLKVARALNYWIRYNEEFGSRFILKVESMKINDGTFHTFCEMIGVPVEARQLSCYVSREINQRKAAKSRVAVSVHLLQSTFPQGYAKLRKLAEKFSYSIEEDTVSSLNTAA